MAPLKNAKKQILISPAGRALFPRLSEPDTKFKKGGEYSVKLILSEADARPLIEQCEAVRQQAFEEAVETIRADKPKMSPDKIREKIALADLPIKPYEDPETGEETGDYQINFKMTASGVSAKTGKEWTRSPAIFDTANKPVDASKVQIWSGSVLKVAYSMSPFYTAALGAGVSIRLEAVQIIQLVSGGQRDASDYGFGAEEDGYAYSDPDEGQTFGGGGGSSDNDNGEEEDF